MCPNVAIVVYIFLTTKNTKNHKEKILSASSCLCGLYFFNHEEH